jgi:uncharacterized tellurite resistance protein B-like protein
MFKNLSEFLESGQKLEIELEGNPSEEELQIATLAMLVTVSHSHEEMSGAELHRICTAMFSEFGLTESETGHRLEVVELLNREEDRLQEFITTINKHLDADQKQRVMALAWRVIMADGEADYEEATVAAELRRALGLTLEQAVRAQKLAQEADDGAMLLSVEEE